MLIKRKQNKPNLHVIEEIIIYSTYEEYCIKTKKVCLTFILFQHVLKVCFKSLDNYLHKKHLLRKNCMNNAKKATFVLTLNGTLLFDFILAHNDRMDDLAIIRPFQQYVYLN